MNSYPSWNKQLPPEKWMVGIYNPFPFGFRPIFRGELLVSWRVIIISSHVRFHLSFQMTKSIQQTNPKPPHLGWWHHLNPTVPGKPPDQQCWTKPTCGTCGLWCCLFSWTLEEDFGKFEVHAILGWQTSIHPTIQPTNQPTNFNDSLGGIYPGSFFTSWKREGWKNWKKNLSI